MAAQPDAHDLTETLLQYRPGLVKLLRYGAVEDFQTEAFVGGQLATMLVQLMCAAICKQREIHLMQGFFHTNTHRSKPASLCAYAIRVYILTHLCCTTHTKRRWRPPIFR